MTIGQMTGTKRKSITRELSMIEQTVLTYARAEAIANRYQVSVRDVQDIGSQYGFMIGAKLTSTPVPAPVRLKEPPVPAEVVATIMRGSIFCVVGDVENAPEDCYVVTKLDKFIKERDAIRKLLGGAT